MLITVKKQKKRWWWWKSAVKSLLLKAVGERRDSQRMSLTAGIIQAVICFHLQTEQQHAELRRHRLHGSYTIDFLSPRPAAFKSKPEVNLSS